MDTVRIIESDNIEDARQLQSDWMARANGVEYGVEIDADIADESIQRIIRNGGTLLVAKDHKDKTAGWMLMVVTPSFLGPQTTATCVFWFALSSGSMAGIKLLDYAKRWAVRKGCAHLNVTASKLASNSYKGICKYCELDGAEHLETIYNWNLCKS